MKFVRLADVNTILSKSNSLNRPYYVKPDMSPTQRLRDSALLKERWSLITSGVPRSSIKIRRSSIYVNNVFHGSLDSNNYFQCSVSVTASTTDSNVSLVTPEESLQDAEDYSGSSNNPVGSQDQS